MIHVTRAEPRTRHIPAADYTTKPVVLECVSTNNLGATVRILAPNTSRDCIVMAPGDTLEIEYKIDAIHVELGV